MTRILQPRIRFVFVRLRANARERFGQGAPADGEQFDGSSRLRQLKASVEAAVPPDARWQGAASQAYAAANKEHAGVYGERPSQGGFTVSASSPR